MWSCLKEVEDRDLKGRELECLGDGHDMLPTGNRQTECKLLIVLTGCPSLGVLLFVSVSSGPAFVARQTVNRYKVHSAVVQIKTSEHYEVELFGFFQSKSRIFNAACVCLKETNVCSCTYFPCLKNFVLPLVSSDACWEMQLLWLLDNYLFMKAFAKSKYSHSLLCLGCWVFAVPCLHQFCV